MKKLKLSAVYSALVVSGLVNSAQASTCSNVATTISGQTAHFEKCTLNFNADIREQYPTYYNRIWFQSLENNLNIADSNLSITSEIEDQGAELINAQNATVNITNSKFSAKLGMGETLNFQNVTGTITDSVFTTALNSDYSYANIISVSKGSNLTINNTTFSASGDVSAIAFEDGNNKVTLNNVTINSEQALNTFWNTVNSTEYTNLDLTINNSNINSQLFSVATPYNEEDSITNIETLNIVAQNSTLSGVIAMPNGVSEQSSYNLVLNNSSWTTAAQNYTDAESGVTEFFSNKLTNLTLNSGTVNLEKVDNFQTLTVGNLSGTGNFTLNTDLANQQSDKIIVKGSDSGSFGLNIKDSGNEPKAANGKVTLVETATGKATFTLLGNGYVDAGAYRYRLVRDGNNWVLFNQSGEQASSSTSANQGSSQSSTNTGSNAGTGTSSGSGSTATSQVVLSEKSNALVSLRQAQLALVESNLEGLHQRLGELKNGEKGNVWVRNVNSRNKFDSTRTASDSHSSGFEQDVHSVQLGADAALTDNIRLGGFVGNARSDVDFDGKYGSGKVKTQSLGLYGTYLANNGFYWDNVAKYEYVKSESASTGKRKYNAYTLSTEIGRIHQLGQGWTVTPQIQAAWTKLSSQSDEERLSALTARVGVRVAKAIEFDGWKLQPYAEVNGITTQTNNNQVRVNQHRFEVSDVEEGKGRFQTALGVNAAVGNHRFGLEGAITNGKYLDQPYKVQAVYRYSW